MGAKSDSDTDTEYIIDSLQDHIVPIDSIILNPANTRRHDERNIVAISNSLKAYGQRKPVVVNSKTNMVEAGNGMCIAAKAMGWRHIAAVFVDDDDYMAKGFEIADNRSSDLSEMDGALLKDAIEFLDTGEYDLEKMIGYQSHEIEMLMTQVHQGENQKGGEGSNNGNKEVTCPRCGEKFTL